ncbi:MAG: MFS transporter [Pirellulaceae bacterium]
MDDSSQSSSDTDTVDSRVGILSVSFFGLLITQLLTATNDNIFRWLVIGVAKDYVDASQTGTVLMAGTVCFVVPYLVLAAPAGYLADRFSKRTVIVACKVAEIAIMVLGVAAIGSEQLVFLFVVVALMGAQSALFSPSKLGIIPELLPANKISAANALFGLTTVAATVVGMGVGSWLSVQTGFRGTESLWQSAAVLLGAAVVGTLTSLAIRRLPAANPKRLFPWNILACTIRDLRTLSSNRPLLRVALGIVFFWSVGALAQLNIDQFAAEGGGLNETAKVPLLVALVFGVGMGSVLAGVWSSGRVELGILPLGAFGIAIASMLLFTVQGTIIAPEAAWTAGFVVACVLLFFLGCSAGLFSVPLEAFMQHRSPSKTRGAILAATNFLTFSGVMVSALVFQGLRLPLREGSLDNVPTTLVGEPLDLESGARIDQLAAEFARQRKAGTPPPIEEILVRVDASERGAALSRLLWIEFRSMRDEKEFINRAEYFERFPEDQLLVKAVCDQATDLPLLDSQWIFFVAGLCTIPVFIYIVWLIPQASIRFLVWLASKTFYRVRVYGRENLPAEGGALLVSNHVSWIDGVMLLLTSSRPIRMILYAGNFENRVLRWLADLWGGILVGSGPKQMRAALETARDALSKGELVCIFPEGAITRSGQLLAFRRGVLKILDGAEAPIIPVYLDGLWGSIFSFERGRFFWKWPRRIPYPFNINFGEPFESPGDVYHIRRVVQDLGARAVQRRTQKTTQMVPSFIRTCRRRRWSTKVADSTGAALTGVQLLTRTLVVRRILRRHVLDDDEAHVGILLPPIAGSTVVNMALAADRRIAVNLNYTVSSEVLNDCITQAGIRHVLTSRKFMEKMDFDLGVKIVFLEDLREKSTVTDKLVSAFQAHCMPAGMLARSLNTHLTNADDVLTIIFTSGSTGQPKGVMLTHGNVASNVEAIQQVVRISRQDVVVGVLPFFHSFGYTVTLWTVMTLDPQVVYHFNPLEARQVGKLCGKHGGTILLATATFLRTYLRRCDVEEFKTLDVVVAGAEKLPISLCDAFEQKFGVRPVEGYGTTELSPLVSVNVPPTRATNELQVERKEGTVGRPAPGIAAKIVEVGTDRELGVGESGMLMISGPNVMKGYLGREELTAKVIRDGWYETGDIALIDEDGFIKITGRQSRFSKIGGEMVPHIKIEETLAEIIRTGEDEELKAAVTAIPDPKKGERLIVIHTELEQQPADLCRNLADAGLPNLFIPSADSFHQVPELPMLGTGKLDLKGIKQIAMEKFGAAE